MSIDQEDSRELQALREQAEAKFSVSNAARAEILSELPGMGKEKPQELLYYLGSRNENFLEFAKRPEVFAELEELVSQLITDDKIYPSKNSGAGYDSDYFKITALSKISLDETYEKLSPDPILLRDKIAELRSIALLVRQYGQKDPEQFIKQRLIFNMVKSLTLLDADTPEKMKRLIPPAELESVRLLKVGIEAARKEALVLDLKKEKTEKYLEQKLHHRMADRIAGVEAEAEAKAFAAEVGQRRAERGGALQKFTEAALQKYQDPRDLVDDLLGLQEGKLPV